MTCSRRLRIGSCQHFQCPHPGDTTHHCGCVDIIDGFCEVGFNCLRSCVYAYTEPQGVAVDLIYAMQTDPGRGDLDEQCSRLASQIEEIGLPGSRAARFVQEFRADLDEVIRQAVREAVVRPMVPSDAAWASIQELLMDLGAEAVRQSDPARHNPCCKVDAPRLASLLSRAERAILDLRDGKAPH